MSVRVSLFEKDGKTFPTIELVGKRESKFGFTFGVSKAKLILENVNDIRNFVEENDQPGL